MAATENKKPTLKYQRDKDREKVRGIFRYHEVPGGAMSFVYRAYKEDPTERYDLVDGQIYTLPLGVAKHLNKNLWYPLYEHIRSEPGMIQGISANGMGGMRIAQKVRRCSFQSLEFVDIEDLTPQGNLVAEVQIAV